MDIAEFEELVDRLGEDVQRWPPEPREAASALLRTSQEARAIVTRAQTLRHALAASSGIKAPAGLADRIVIRARRESTRQAPPVVAIETQSWHRTTFVRPVIVLSLCFAVGLTAGLLPSGTQGEGAIDFPTLLARLIE